MQRREEDAKTPATARRIGGWALILVGIIVPLLVMTYTTGGPRLGSWPQFHGYQLVLISFTAGLTAVAYLLVRHDGRKRTRQVDATEGDDTGGDGGGTQ